MADLGEEIKATALHSSVRRMLTEKMVEYSQESRDVSAHWMDRRDALLRLECISGAVAMLDIAWLKLEEEARSG